MNATLNADVTVTLSALGKLINDVWREKVKKKSINIYINQYFLFQRSLIVRTNPREHLNCAL